MSVFCAPAGYARAEPIQPLHADAAFAARIVKACLKMTGKWPGDVFHGWVLQGAQKRWQSEGELGRWMFESLCRQAADHEMSRVVSRRIFDARFDRVCRQADREASQQGKVYAWKPEFLPSHFPAPCPRVFFTVRDDPLGAQPLTAVFNSRKPRLIEPQAPWLTFLRSILHLAASEGMGLASSWGTATYDLVTTFALHRSLPLLVALPLELEAMQLSSHLPPVHEVESPLFLLNGCPKEVLCSKADRMQCRDRLLAALADFHVVAEVRAGGSLEATLGRQQSFKSRRQWIFQPVNRSRHNKGNERLAGEFPHRAVSMAEIKPASPQASGAHPEPAEASFPVLSPQAVPWEAYLYHYTRACPGPWPGETYQDYLLGLLREENPEPAHTALQTLIRILREKRLRAGSRLIRGGVPVVSWTARPPHELRFLRQWNPALLRWTFEPYGVAVKRRRLLEQGAKPVIYSPEKVYTRLKASERFRFQRTTGKRSTWKHEREWRLPRDLDLEELSADEVFIFVADREDAALLARSESFPYAAVVLSALKEDGEIPSKKPADPTVGGKCGLLSENGETMVIRR